MAKRRLKMGDDLRRTPLPKIKGPKTGTWNCGCSFVVVKIDGVYYCKVLHKHYECTTHEAGELIPIIEKKSRGRKLVYGFQLELSHFL